MILADADLLLYAYHPRAEPHATARQWLGSSVTRCSQPNPFCRQAS